MKCPRDQTELTIKSKEGVVGYCCNDCNGIFLKGSGMKAFKLNFETKVLEYSFKNPSNTTSDLHCINCNAQMQLSVIDDVEIDICQQCQSVWFDKTEVESIIYRNRQNLTDLESSGIDFALIPFPLDLIYGLFRLFK
jgi:Zn-finger nucleic acid-binding protein